MSQPTNAKLFRKKFYQKGNSDNNTKAQSAMEYLMTYGWAILIIAVILAVFEFLGVFNTGTFIGPSCLATPGYICSNPVMTANANGPNLLLFNFKQDTGQTLYNVSFACAASSTSQGYPNVNVNSGFNTSSNLTVLTSGSSVTVSGLECYTSNGNLFKDNPIGAVFLGTLWIRYNLQGYPPSEYQYAKIAKITAKVESEAAISAMQSSPTQLTFSSLSPSSPSIDTGKSITLTVSWLGGVSPFTVNWLSGASAGSMSLLSSHTGIVSSSLSDSLSVAPTSNTYYSANVIDSSTPPNVVSSLLDLVTVNPALSVPSISASSTALVAGQSVTFSSSWTGGTAPYTAKLYSSSTLPCTSLSSLVQTETTSANSISFPAITPTQTAYYCIYVNDSSYHSSETENSITQEVIDTTPSTILYYVPIKISNQGGPTPSSVPSGIVSYVPITITNGETVPTSAPFQQMVNITESQFSSYNITYSNTIANFEFFTQSGTVIPAWIESNDSGKLITWVNLQTSIPEQQAITIYIGFASKTTNLLSSSGTAGIGEAPQLSSTYAQYDDGAYIFPYYQRWGGLSMALPSGWGVIGTPTLTYNSNSITIEGTASTYQGVQMSSSNQPPFPSIMETYSELFGCGNSCGTASFTWTTSGFVSPYYIVGSQSSNNDYVLGVAGSYYVSSSQFSTLPATFSLIYSSSTSGILLQNYTSIVSGSGSSPQTGLFLGYETYGAGSISRIYWTRYRAYPPNGAMPTVTFDFPQATGTGFQQMVNITESSFSSYLTYNSNFANFEYFYANGTIIPSWIESNNSGKLVTWAKLSKSIPALSNTTIYLGFAGSNNLLSSSGTTGIGEAPQLSATYAEYDDGASVFTNYWNFAGTSLPSEFGLENYCGVSQTGTITVDNGVTLSAGSSDCEVLYSSSLFSLPFIFETLSKSNAFSTVTNGFDVGTLISDSLLSSTATLPLNSELVYKSATSPAIWSENDLNLGSLSTQYIFGVGGTTSNYYDEFNYNNITLGRSLPSAVYLFPIDIDSGATQYTQWARTRAYPPYGAMPTATFGSVS